MSTLKSETARRNGAKSRGPVSPEGRAKSSRNSLRHGLTAKSFLLPQESAEEFQSLVDAYLKEFHPVGIVESDFVQIMAVTRWRLNRVPSLEANVVMLETLRRTRHAENFDIEKDPVPMAWMFQKLADEGKALALIMRYESSLNRAFDRAFRQLRTLQAARLRACAQPQPQTKPQTEQQNEPKPGPVKLANPLQAQSLSVPPGIIHIPLTDPPADPSIPFSPPRTRYNDTNLTLRKDR